MIKKIKNARNKLIALQRKRRREKIYDDLIGKRIIADKDANDLIYKKIIENKPCLITRFGSSELATLLFYIRERLVNGENSKWNTHHEHILCDVSGFFPF